MPLLDARLRCLADLVPVCDLAADIGADHGRLACYLLSSGTCQRMIVSDISRDSLDKSRRLLSLHNLESRAEFIEADGLDALVMPVSAVIIAGMGGKTIADMLKKHRSVGDAKLIVSANTQMPILRQKLYEYGFFFETETVIRSNGRFYTALSARRGQRHYTPRELYISPVLKGDCVEEYLIWRRDVVFAQRDNMREAHLKWLSEEIEHENRKQSADI